VRSAERRIRVRIPSGAKDGTRIKLKGKGGAGMRGGPAGDLHVITRVMPSPVFTRKGDDLVVEVPVTFAEAALGAKIEVPTLGGRVKITVPAGSQDGRTLRVPGKGAPKLNGSGAGSLLAKGFALVAHDAMAERTAILAQRGATPAAEGSSRSSMRAAGGERPASASRDA
jgi:molecular chaperone DnaJ